MLTAQEVHIEINQGFQKVASNIYDYFQKEEVDWAYNKVRSRFIESCVRPRKDNSGAFEINQASLDDIQNIININREIVVFKDNSTRAYGILPSDYGYLINDRSIIVSDCTSTFTSDTTTKTEFINLLKFEDSTKGSPKYYDEFTIVLDGETVFDIDDYTISAGLNSKNEKFVLIHLVLDSLTYQGINIYWERYQSIYEPNTFIIITNNSVEAILTVDGVETPFESTAPNYDIFMEGNEDEVPNRLINSAALPSVLKDVYNKTIPRSPISNLSANRLNVFYSKRFIVNTLVIDYVRKPRNLSIILGTSCELSEKATRKVCDLTVEYLKNIIESPVYQMKLNDNAIRME